MKILNYIKNLFHKKEKITVYCKTCKQRVDPIVYDKKTKSHKIGSVRNKLGKILTIYCDGKEI